MSRSNMSRSNMSRSNMSRSNMSRSNMSRSSQPDLFGTQGDLFGPPPKQSYVPSLEKVRTEVNKVLDKARIARDLPWTAKEVAFWKTVFPQMTNWLPEVEREQARAAFTAEISRLEASVAGGSTHSAAGSRGRKKSPTS